MINFFELSEERVLGLRSTGFNLLIQITDNLIGTYKKQIRYSDVYDWFSTVTNIWPSIKYKVLINRELKV